ncbi:tetratricopeptide repeat protein [Xanthobacter agilis]|uniref:Tetratricopeptide (TPR) repeat protein n=2 Tax=Xanthobacter agilis TaxID=47492 RepID=A0ABU0LAI3_XANAG|nr:tetratricopeptide (TPR) repeat protein [Xanthobacter agilis]
MPSLSPMAPAPMPRAGDQAGPLAARLAAAAAREAAGDLEAAEDILSAVLMEAPDHPDALHQAALVSFARMRRREAVSRLERAIAAAPGTPLFHRNLCEIQRARGELDSALHHGRTAVALAPHDPGAAYNLCVVHSDRMEIEEAIRLARRAIALDPGMAGAHFELAEGLLLNGRFAEGWEEYEWRFRLPNVAPPLPQTDRPQWDGAPLPGGTVLLIADQGFGDSIQFCRYIPQVARRCARVVVACSIELQPIIRQQSGLAFCFDRWEQAPAFDAYCPLSGLPRVFGTDLPSVPAPVPYVAPPPAKVGPWAARLDGLVPRGMKRVGIVWAGRPTHGNDLNRSMPLEALTPLGEMEGVALISLQMGAAMAQVAHHYGPAPLMNLGAEIADFTDTMAILHLLDHVVAVDTSIVHLAGAMGRPVSVLLPFAPDWRWMRDRDDSPWYPTARLFRQPAPGDWAEPVRRVCAQVARLP